MNKAWLEGGKLIVQSEDEIGATAAISELGSARLAVAFDFSFAEAAGAGSHCVFEIQNSEEGASRRSTSVVFSANGAVELHHYVHPDGENYAEGRYDPKRVNAVKVVMLGEEVAVFLNDKLHFTAQDGSASPFSFQNLSAYNPIRCEIHNYRIWDLSGMAPGP
jgi:hypothetical protein